MLPTLVPTVDLAILWRHVRRRRRRPTASTARNQYVPPLIIPFKRFILFFLSFTFISRDPLANVVITQPFVVFPWTLTKVGLILSSFLLSLTPFGSLLAYNSVAQAANAPAKDSEEVVRTTRFLPYVEVPHMDTTSRPFRKAEATVAKAAKPASPASSTSTGSPTTSTNSKATVERLFNVQEGTHFPLF